MATYVSIPTGSAANWTAKESWYNTESGTRGVVLGQSTSKGTNTTTGYVYNGDAQDITGTNGKNCVGIIMFCKRLTTTGTVTIGLSADSGTTRTIDLTVNATDLPTNPSWVFFKWASPLALDGGSDYAICVMGSSSGNATFYRNSSTAADWYHALVWDDSPASAITTGDVTYIVGALTGAASSISGIINMNETSTTIYGDVFIGNLGILSYDSSSAFNPYLKLGGNLNVFANGTFNIGIETSPIPRDSIAVLEFNCASDGQYGVTINIGGSSNIQGLSRTNGKNIVGCLLNTNAEINDTSLSVDADTGWLDNDSIVVCSTSRTYTETEKGTMASDAGASSLTVDGFAGVSGGLAYVHLGTPPIQAEVVNLTRNIIIRSVNTSYNTYYYNNDGSVNLDWAEFCYCRVRLYCSSGGFSYIDYCSIHDTRNIGLVLSGDAAKLYAKASNNVIYLFNTAQVSSDYNSYCEVSYSYYISGDSLQYGATIITNQANFHHNYFVSSRTNSRPNVCLKDSSNTIFSNNIVHSGRNIGVEFYNSCSSLTLSNNYIYRNSAAGVRINSQIGEVIIKDIIFDNNYFFGNVNYNIYCGVNSILYLLNITFSNCSFSGESTFSTSYGIYFDSYLRGVLIKFYNCNFGVVNDIYRNHVNYDIYVPTNNCLGGIDMNNCTLASPNQVGDVINNYFYIKNNYNNAVKGGKSWFYNGIIEIDNNIYNDGNYANTPPSEKITPKSASVKIESGQKKVSVLAGATFTISVKVRKSKASTGDSADYNGNQPNLILKRSDGMGITADVTCDTVSTDLGVWDTLTYTTSAGQALLDGVLEFCVDCDGTTGFINVDAWSLS